MSNQGFKYNVDLVFCIDVSHQDEVSLRTVTGYLVKMDFESRCITLKYPTTNTELACYYTDSLEVELFENRRELVQVTGNVTYDCQSYYRNADNYNSK